MSELIKNSIKMSKELRARMSEENIKRRHLFVCYLIAANRVMDESEELEFHNPTSEFHYWSHFTIRMRNGRIEKLGYGYRIEESLEEYLASLINTRETSMPISGVERAIEELEHSIGKKITPGMVMENYNEYKRLVAKGFTPKEAVKILSKCYQ